jgi:hypothetical protein
MQAWFCAVGELQPEIIDGHEERPGRAILVGRLYS